MNNEQVQEIFVEDIIPNRFQPRLHFDENALKELSDSIKTHGIIQPLVLRKLGNKYEIIAGERRYKASCMAGLTKVPAIVREMTDNESAEVALIENIQRRNLTSIEEAQSFKSLLNRGYLTQEELAKKLGVTQPTIANKMRLLNLPDEVQEALLNSKISERHARSLLQITDVNEQNKMLNRIINERLTVKQLDAEIKKLLNGESLEEKNEVQKIEKVEENTTMENIVEKPSEDINQNNNYNTADHKTNIFGISVEPPTDLEKTAPNLSTGSGEENPPIAFNPFNSINTEPEKEEIETFNIFGDTIKPEEISTPGLGEDKVTKNIGDQIISIRNVVKNVEEKGFTIELEEYDFEDMYQMIIKIKK